MSTSFNRNIVECKCRNRSSSHRGINVLIETLWNVNRPTRF